PGPPPGAAPAPAGEERAGPEGGGRGVAVGPGPGQRGGRGGGVALTWMPGRPRPEAEPRRGGAAGARDGARSERHSPQCEPVEGRTAMTAVEGEQVASDVYDA